MYNGNDINKTDLLYKYKHYEKQERESKASGSYYPFGSKEEDSKKYRVAVQQLSADMFKRLDNMIDKCKSNKAAEQHMKKIYNFELLKSDEFDMLVDAEVSSPLLSVSADLVTMRRAYEYADAHVKLLGDDINENNIEHFLYKTYVYDILLNKYSLLYDALSDTSNSIDKVFDLQRFAIFSERIDIPEPYRQPLPTGEVLRKKKVKQYSEIDRAKLKSALLWLYRQHMPFDIFEKIHVIRVDRYIDMLRSTMLERMAMIQQYIMKYPLELLQSMRNVKNKIFSPLYEWINKLPRIPGEADDVLYDILLDIQNIETEFNNKMVDILHINKLEEYLYNKRLEATKRLNKQLAFNDTLKELLNQIESFGIDNVIDIILKENNNSNDTHKRRMPMQI